MHIFFARARLRRQSADTATMDTCGDNSGKHERLRVRHGTHAQSHRHTPRAAHTSTRVRSPSGFIYAYFAFIRGAIHPRHVHAQPSLSVHQQHHAISAAARPYSCSVYTSSKRGHKAQGTRTPGRTAHARIIPCHRQPATRTAPRTAPLMTPHLSLVHIWARGSRGRERRYSMRLCTRPRPLACDRAPAAPPLSPR